MVTYLRNCLNLVGGESVRITTDDRKGCVMKRIVLEGLLIVLVFSLVGMSHAGMYWEMTEEPEDNIPKTQMKALSPATSGTASQKPTLVKMYDDGEVLQIEDEPQDVPRPVPASSVESPALQPRIGPRTSAPASTQRRPAVTPSPRREMKQERPKQIQSAPGQPVEGKPQESIVKPDAAGEGGSTEPPPVTKKMPWGKVDVKPAEPQPLLQWGNNKPE